MAATDSKPKQLPLPLEYETTELHLTQGYIAIVDTVDSDLQSIQWYPANKSGRIYVWSKTGERINGQLRTIHLHRLIYERVIGRQLDRRELVDHKDNNPLNNRRSNLRLANKRLNAQNSKKRKNSLSSLKGAQWSSQSQKWVSEITVDGKRKRLGAFDDPKDAHEAYCNAAKEHFGEFARFD